MPIYLTYGYPTAKHSVYSPFSYKSVVSVLLGSLTGAPRDRLEFPQFLSHVSVVTVSYFTTQIILYSSV
ncbi:hypothetical protein PUN28_003486 [Cardiocondyla obscurior]|uniref:Uncharacterized protein n=1 Tax=Cardiocondyla obscurior TaxID=286306 RepID=A0AAW2GMD4_9HYME